MAIDWRKVDYFSADSAYMEEVWNTKCGRCGIRCGDHMDVPPRCRKTGESFLPVTDVQHPVTQRSPQLPAQDQSSAFLRWLVAPAEGNCACNVKRSVCKYHKDSDR